jgi:hypothetical protein
MAKVQKASNSKESVVCQAVKEDKEVGVRWPPAWELVRELQFSGCELLLLEAGS